MTHHKQHDFESTVERMPPTLYEAKALGAPFKVFLSDGVTFETDPDTGREVTNIADLSGLIAAVVRSRVLHSRKLCGEDLKFIRSALCMKSNEIAENLELTPEHYSRCEAGTKTMSVSTEKQHRIFVFFSMLTRDKNLQRPKVRNVEDMKISEKDAFRVTKAVFRIFLDMKIDPVYEAGEELSFTFCRKCRAQPAPEGDDDEWGVPLEMVA
ncbi:hypothetical protein [Mesorhizobium sp.]|uniref:hypothetical protein n=1 Tax=Mesorhizobium sp. TaxID=1871066 RepID=UPI000FE4DEFD|nr:hypothetical protein [Mesorhizobium sp.]RWD62673.1 MAG: hypothetical protein EOS37_30510 [Mesorhizobium sp.]TIV56432.1 MAG: hypothetical protein E5V80_26920 [Mesorhizobium sp.]